MSDARLRIAVLGPGGVGGLVAGALSVAGEAVTVVARESTAAVIAERGLRVDSVALGELMSRPAAVAHLEQDVDVLVVATKAGGLAAALERVHVTPRLVLPLLNGLEHIALLRRHFPHDAGGRVVVATIRVEAERIAPGHVVHTSPAVRIEMASRHGGARPAMERVAVALTGARLPAQLLDSEATVLWSKLVRLNALACATSAFARPLGAIRTTPGLHAELVGAVRETTAVARAEGAELSVEQPLGELAAAHASLTSSMARDIAAGREPELDAIAGAVLRAAARHALPCPTVERLVGLIERRLPDGAGAVVRATRAGEA